MQYPFLRRRDRGSGAGRAEIVFSEDHGYGKAQLFADRGLKRCGLTVTHRMNGPSSWLWDVRGAGGEFIFSYDDFPCETTLFAASPESDPAVARLMNRLLDQPADLA